MLLILTTKRDYFSLILHFLHLNDSSCYRKENLDTTLSSNCVLSSSHPSTTFKPTTQYRRRCVCGQEYNCLQRSTQFRFLHLNDSSCYRKENLDTTLSSNCVLSSSHPSTTFKPTTQYRRRCVCGQEYNCLQRSTQFPAVHAKKWRHKAFVLADSNTTIGICTLVRIIHTYIHT